jgi:hypothetical protein
MGWTQSLRRRLLKRGYPRGMAPLGGKRAVGPARPDLSSYEGLWVAILDGQVIDAGETSHTLALRLREMDHRKRHGAVVEFVRPTVDSYIVGAG